MKTNHTVDVRLTRGGNPATVKWELDWESVSEDMLRMMATKTVIIKLQADARKCKTLNEVASKWGNRTIKVAGIEWGKRSRVDKAAKAENILNELSPEQLAEVLARVKANKQEK